MKCHSCHSSFNHVIVASSTLFYCNLNKSTNNIPTTLLTFSRLFGFEFGKTEKKPRSFAGFFFLLHAYCVNSLKYLLYMRVAMTAVPSLPGSFTFVLPLAFGIMVSHVISPYVHQIDGILNFWTMVAARISDTLKFSLDWIIFYILTFLAKQNSLLFSNLHNKLP